MNIFRFAFLLAALCGSCQAPSGDRSRAQVPEDGLLVDVSSVERSRVSTARVAHGRMRDDLAAAHRQLQQAVSDQAAASRLHNAASDKVDWAEAAVAKSETTDTSADIEKARQELRDVRVARNIQTARCELRDREVIEAEMQTKLAEARVQVTAARLDLAKVMAVNTLERPDVQKPDVARFEAVVRVAEGKENVARAGFAAAAREVEIGRGKLSELDPSH